MVLVPWELVLFKGMGVEFKGKIIFRYSRGVTGQQGFTTGVGFYVYNVIGYSNGTENNCVVFNTAESQSSGP